MLKSIIFLLSFVFIGCSQYNQNIQISEMVYPNSKYDYYGQELEYPYSLQKELSYWLEIKESKILNKELYYEYNFDNFMDIKKIEVNYEKNFDNIKKIEIYDGFKWKEYPLEKITFNNNNKMFYLKNGYDCLTNEIKIKITIVNEKGFFENIINKDYFKIKFLVVNPDLDYFIIKYNLQNRLDKNKNQELINFIKEVDEDLFKKLKEDKII